MSVGVVFAGLVGAVLVGELVNDAEISELLDTFLVVSPAVAAAFLAGGVAARVHREPHRRRRGRHRLAAVLGPLLVGAYGAVAVAGGIDHEALARVANLVLPVGAALAGARLLDRREDAVATVPAGTRPWR